VGLWNLRGREVPACRWTCGGRNFGRRSDGPGSRCTERSRLNAVTVSFGADGSAVATFDGKEGRLTFFTNGACQGCALPNVHSCFPHLTQVARQMQSLGYPASHPPGLVLLDLWDGGHARLFTEEEGGGTIYGVALSAIWGRAGEAYAFAAATLTPATPVVSYQRSPIWTKTYARWVAILKEASVGLNASMP